MYKRLAGELLFVLCALAVLMLQQFHLTGLTYWNMVPVLLFGAAWVIFKRRGRIARYSIAVGSTLAMLMLIYSNLVLLLDRRETGTDAADVLLLYVPFYSILIGALGCLAIFIVLSIKRRRGEF
ncbi:hypothetical protein ACR0ST_06270 [Aliidiomarina sp. Khilg15.8]